MNCPNCGSPLRFDARFCPVCGVEIVYNPTVPTARTVVESPETENKGLKITLIILAALLAVVVIGAGLYFGLKYIPVAKDTDDKVCRECNEKFEGSGDLCKDCKEKDDPEDRNSGNGEECRQCGDELDTDGLLCSGCLDDIDDSLYTSGYICDLCEDSISEEEIAVVDSLYGHVFCEYCDGEPYCDDCNAPLGDRYDDDSVCYRCANFACYSCREVLDRDEVANTDRDGNDYCYDCYYADESSFCNQCGDSHANSGLLCDSCLAEVDEAYYSDGYECFWCGEHLYRSEIAIVDYEGLVYCEDCDHGTYCDGCGAPLSSAYASGYCGYCS